PHQPKMPAMPARQELDNGGSLAMPPHAQHDAVVGPFHGVRLQDSGDERSFAQPSFRGASKTRTRNLEILRCAIVHHGSMRSLSSGRAFARTRWRRPDDGHNSRVEPALRVAGKGII